MGRSTVLWYLNKKYHIISCCVSTSFVRTLKIKEPIKDICKNLLAGLHLSASEQHVCHNQFLLRQELRKHNSSITEFHKKPCIICIIIKVGSWHLFCKRFTLKDLGNNAWPMFHFRSLCHLLFLFVKTLRKLNFLYFALSWKKI